MSDCPYIVGDKVTWSDKTPQEWKYLFTEGPMTVIDTDYHNGKANDYAMKFGTNGFDLKPGWVITVEYDANSTSYYNPPLSIIFNSKKLKMMIHEMWLIKA